MPQNQLITSKHPPERIMRAICSTQWAMLEDDLRVILDIASRESQLDPQAVSALMGKPLDNTAGVTVRDGVGIIPVIGPIFRYGSMFTRISGATSIDSLALDFQEALSNPNVHAILFEVDSPGGEVAGTGEFANMIYSARMTQDKPIWSYVSNLGASAAYWIASACDQIVVSPTSIVGSIGVVAAMRKPDAKDKTIEFVSSQSPNKRPNLNTQEGRSQVQATIDSLAEVFVSTVARNRGVDANTVVNDFGHGGVKVGQESVSCGLADSVGTFEACIEQINTPVDNIRPIRRVANLNVGGALSMSLQTRWDDLKRFINADDLLIADSDGGGDTVTNTPTSLDVEEPTTDEITESIVAGPATTKGYNMDEIAQLKAENMRLKVERYNAEANTFVAIALTEGRAFPAEREALIAAFIQASLDDATLGANDAGTSRISMLHTMISMRPKHQLTAETLAPSLADMLRQSPRQAGLTQNDEGEVSDDDVKMLLNKTSMGRSVVKAINGN